jgi:hypothetical protein
MNKILKLASTILILTTGLGVATTVNSSTNYLVSHESHNRVGHSHKKSKFHQKNQFLEWIYWFTKIL